MLITTKKNKITIGIDEVGRGCGAGPLMACAFAFLEPCDDLKLKDSKELSYKKRLKIFEQLAELRNKNKTQWSLVSISSNEIDARGVQKANIEAIRLSANNLINNLIKNDSYEFEIIVDGNLKLNPIFVNDCSFLFNSVIKADKKYPSVSAASIIAKVLRDRYMEVLHNKHPQYCWKENKGYLTSDHCSAIKETGLSPFHRRSFCRKLKNGP